ncbi:TetR/AcrR family transcriptional regulator [Phaeodactylibacter sp.]|jgi:AcrR family transcriptional regulator|uniref:TetR/AcrR family transcriptional regulator n=1 Tax=Phaeodactylibacter sp. TaxID=1940289 RepID=UPI0025EF87E6|nr:TetR/AcrR family transcriptional regulator [Phaeodactylibacter sp.]MCI4648939.1 TetR/AcrR family transcriptional regulator [Phaeodactylibacter sp.]MCI5091818.1 TetR/AcrR family transcriptional regulator [Phaeodactylibacter sp.]
MSTKEKILAAALKRFNADGMVNVRLQHIADEAGKSVGNLAYHFPNKQAIVLGLYKKLETEQIELLREFRIVPLFDNIDRLLEAVFQHQQTYRFFYLDTLEVTRAFPDVQAEYQKHIETEVQQWLQILEFNTARGVMSPEPRPGFHTRLALQLWATSTHYMAQEMVRSTVLPGLEAYKTAVWNLLIPLFTKLGHREYEQMLQSPYDLYF